MFHRVGAWCARRRGIVVVAWVLLLVAGGAISGSVGSDFSTQLNLPEVESKQGFDVLEREMGGIGTGIEGTIVIESDDGFDDPGGARAADRLPRQGRGNRRCHRLQPVRRRDP
ncbi:MAG: hypothetical protein V9E94_11810 [Microthrixaceae bacterium]